MSCNNCNSLSCNSTCGCPQQVKGSCVFYQGANLSCLDVTKGDDYDSILANLNTLICDLVAPTGLQTTLTGCGSITVTQTSATNYNVCLSNATQTQINNNTTNIATLSTCVDNGVLDIVSNDGSILITEDTPSSGCGRILDLSVITPTGIVSYDGIIENDFSNPSGSNSSGTPQSLKNWTNDFTTSSQITTGDIITVTVTGQADVPAGVLNPSQSYKLSFSSGSASEEVIITPPYFGESDSTRTYAFEMVMRINVKSATEAVISSHIEFLGWVDNSTPNSYLGTTAGISLVIRPLKSKIVTGINWGSVTLDVSYTNFSPGLNFEMGEFFVDVRKKL